MGGRTLVIGFNARTNRYDEILSRQSRIEDTGGTAHFGRNGEQVCIPCDLWIRLEDNVNAIALAIGALQERERWGAKRMVDQAFAGFAALPAGTSSWWEVLGVSRMASRQEVEAAYRRLVRVHRPDAGGNPELLLKVKAAFEMASQGVEK